MRAELAFHVGQELEITIDDLAAGGDGVGRVGGCVVFVPLSARGDRLRVEVERIEARRLHARIVAVVEPSPARREPACAHFSRCGGCAWQHVDAATQRDAKGRIVREALARVGGIHVEGPIEVRAGDEYGWRSRAEMHVVRAKDGRAAPGWLRRASHDVEPVTACPVLVPALQRVVADLASGSRTIPPAAARVHLAAGDDDVAVAFDDAHGRPIRDGRETVVARTVSGHSFGFEARAFFQGNGALVDALVDAALEGLDERAGEQALDLFSGAGLFTLPLARRFGAVVGVEGDARAVELARANAAANGISNARFEHAGVADWLARAPRDVRPRTVLLDPPRRGAGPRVVDAIAALRPEEVRYVSCDPATLARDLAGFVGQGYALVSIVALDLFPQTPHVECVAVLRRGA